MFSTSKLFVLALFLAIVAVSISEAAHVSVCSIEEIAVNACSCCKNTCWIRTVQSMTDVLGHMPGEKSNDEATMTLAMIRECFTRDCDDDGPCQ